jgi:hypothetical protein
MNLSKLVLLVTSGRLLFLSVLSIAVVNTYMEPSFPNYELLLEKLTQSAAYP